VSGNGRLGQDSGAIRLSECPRFPSFHSGQAPKPRQTRARPVRAGWAASPYGSSMPARRAGVVPNGDEQMTQPPEESNTPACGPTMIDWASTPTRDRDVGVPEDGRRTQLLVAALVEQSSPVEEIATGGLGNVSAQGVAYAIGRISRRYADILDLFEEGGGLTG
jgi:hypothetical protein